MSTILWNLVAWWSCLPSDGDKKWVSSWCLTAVTFLWWSSHKISTGSDTACSFVSYFCNENPAASHSLLKQGLVRGLCKYQRYLSVLATVLQQQCVNGAVEELVSCSLLPISFTWRFPLWVFLVLCWRWDKKGLCSEQVSVHIHAWLLQAEVVYTSSPFLIPFTRTDPHLKMLRLGYFPWFPLSSHSYTCSL